MPVRRFRTVEDMSRAHWREAGDPDLYRTMARLWAFGQRSGVHHFPPGVYRSRSMEEVNERSDQWKASLELQEQVKAKWKDLLGS